MTGGWALVAGIAGLILAGLWGFTDHVMAYRNENLFQLNPLALLLAPAMVLGDAGRSSGRAALGRLSASRWRRSPRWAWC